MNKVVRHHYPIERLPEDLRAGLSSGTVTIVVTEEAQTKSQGHRLSLDEFKALRDGLPVSDEDPVKRVRALRDEWD